jgi:hypothetical protein
MAHDRGTLASALGALGPGGTISITFDDYARMFSPKGEHPHQFDEEGAREMGAFAAKHHCAHKHEPEKKLIHFMKN